MSRILSILTLYFTIISCTSTDKTATNVPAFEYGNYSEKTEKSSLKIDDTRTLEKFFTLTREVKCLEISVDSVKLRKTFPIGRENIRTYFHVEKLLKTGDKGSVIQYVPIGKNYNNEWTTYSPVKICTKEEAPLSRLSPGRYRLRFSTLDSKSFFYKIKIKSEAPVEFSE